MSRVTSTSSTKYLCSLHTLALALLTAAGACVEIPPPAPGATLDGVGGDADVQPEPSADAEPEAAPEPPAPASSGAWDCLGAAPPSDAVPPSFTYALRVLDEASGQGRPGVSVRACEGQVCGESTDTDADGLAVLNLSPSHESGFSGYLELDGGGIKPSLVFDNRPIRSSPKSPREVEVFDAATFDAVIGGPGSDDLLGHLVVDVFDCEGGGAQGMVVDAAELALVYGDEGGDPTLEATDVSGRGGALMQDERSLRLTVRFADLPIVIGSGDVEIRAGHVSHIALHPQPAAPDLSCAPVGEHPPRHSPTAPVDVTLVLEDALDGAPAVDVLVRACPRFDEACDPDEVATGRTDETGRVLLSVDAKGEPGFVGYFEVEGAQLAPALLFAGEPIGASNQDRVLRFPVFDASELESLRMTAGSSGGHPSGAHVVFRTLDCARLPMANGQVWHDRVSGAAWFADYGNYATTTYVTDASGLGGWFDIPPERFTLRSSLGQTAWNDAIALGSARALARPGWVSTVLIPPSLTQSDWRCLDDLQPPAPPEARTIELKAFVNNAWPPVTFPELPPPVVGATVRLCAADDATCGDPIAVSETDATGHVVATLEVEGAGFDGYAEVEAEGFPSTIGFANFPLNGSETLFIGLVPNEVVAFLEQLIAPFLPGHGHVLAILLECPPELAATSAGWGLGVSLAATPYGPDSQTVYLSPASELDPDTTGVASTTLNVAGILNLPVGATTLTTRLYKTGEYLGERLIYIRDGWVTTGLFAPMAEEGAQ